MEIKYIVNNPETVERQLSASVKDFCGMFNPVEDVLYIFKDELTRAIYCECHIPANLLIELGTVDSPLDAENQSEYRANRDIVENDTAFFQMKEDARNKRSFSNIVAEFNTSFDEKHPLKIIGGQHRFEAIKEALSAGTNQLHGVKAYFCLNTEQRLDVQLISNTNIAVSSDLLDRMLETVKGPELRAWCQEVGLLSAHEDFSDKKRRGGRITVRAARTFVMNYYEGSKIPCKEFQTTKTIPVLAKTGGVDEEWESLKLNNPGIWSDTGLKEAGKAFARLIEKQRAAFTKAGGKTTNGDYADKASGYAIVAAWAYVAGCLQDNKTRLQRHFALCDHGKPDPLNAKALASAKHTTDPDNYRGLGTRMDSKERGRLTELFYFQAETGKEINGPSINCILRRSVATGALTSGHLALRVAGQISW